MHQDNQFVLLITKIISVQFSQGGWIDLVYPKKWAVSNWFMFMIYECMKDQIANKSLCKLIYQEELIFNN